MALSSEIAQQGDPAGNEAGIFKCQRGQRIHNPKKILQSQAPEATAKPPLATARSDVIPDSGIDHARLTFPDEDDPALRDDPATLRPGKGNEKLCAAIRAAYPHQSFPSIPAFEKLLHQ